MRGVLGRIVYYVIAVLLIAQTLPQTTTASPLPLPPVLISEIITGTTASASAEFVELYNSTTSVIDLTGWRLEYKPATGGSWTAKATLTGEIQAHGFYLVASSLYQSANQSLTYNDTLSAGLAASGGHIRLVEVSTGNSDAVLDLVGWGTADSAEGGHPALAPTTSQSLARQFLGTGEILDTNDNLADFSLSNMPTPESTPAPPPDPNPGPVIPPDPDPTPPPTTYLPLQITELLPDPISPATDDNDEFIELFNNNTQTVPLGGYVLKAGSSLEHSFTLPALSLEPGGYVVYYSSTTHLALVNSGAQVQLFDPNGAAASELVTYDEAPPGQSWNLLTDGWAWSDQITPAADNKRATTAPVESVPETTCDGVILSEALPNPAGTDAGHEFIELFNPTDEAIVLNGCGLQVFGNSLVYRFEPTATLKPDEYIAFYDSKTNLTLPNAAGGTIFLLSAASEELDSVDYGADLDDDVSWSRFGDEWSATFTPTPGAANELLATKPCPTGQERSAETGRCHSTSSADGSLGACAAGKVRNPDTNRCRQITTTSGTLAPCAAGKERNPATNRCRSILGSTGRSLVPCQPGQARNPLTNRCRKVVGLTTAKTAGAASAFGTPAAIPTSSISTKVVATALALALLYGAYEFRYDIRNRFEIIRRYFHARSHSGP